MDEVLASLKRGSFHLRKVDQHSLPSSKGDDDPNSILAQWRPKSSDLHERTGHVSK